MISIVPLPDSLHETGDDFLLGASSAIHAGKGCERIAQQLRRRLYLATGFELPLHGADSAISLEIDSALAPSGYRISVRSSGVQLRGGDEAGVFLATQTLLQLLPVAIFRNAVVVDVEWRVPGVEVADEPRFGWRGMLLDLSRHFFGRDSILKIIDALALHRMNVLHLHLTDDQGWRMEILRYPRLTEIGSRRSQSAMEHYELLPPGQTPRYDGLPHDGYLTQDDLREIVAYAADRFITVLPEIDLPGHAQAAIAAYPQLGNINEPLPVWTEWGVNPHVLNAEESTIEFYENVFAEVLDVFPGKYVHVGGDECPVTEWEASPAAQKRILELGVGDEIGLQGWFVKRFSSYLEQHGRKLVGWDEILDGPAPIGATIMAWRGIDAGIAAAKAGHDVVMTPESDTYLYRRQSMDPTSEPRAAEPPLLLRTIFDYDPVPPELSSEVRARILGAQCQMWTEFVVSERQMHQMVFPRMSAFAESLWRRHPVSFEHFEARLEVHLERLHAMGIDAYRPTSGARRGDVL